MPDIIPPKQPFWDRPGVLADNSSLSLLSQSASFLVASSPHSGDRLFALPVTLMSVANDDELLILLWAYWL